MSREDPWARGRGRVATGAPSRPVSELVSRLPRPISTVSPSGSSSLSVTAVRARVIVVAVLPEPGPMKMTLVVAAVQVRTGHPGGQRSGAGHGVVGVADGGAPEGEEHCQYLPFTNPQPRLISSRRLLAQLEDFRF